MKKGPEGKTFGPNHGSADDVNGRDNSIPVQVLSVIQNMWMAERRLLHVHGLPDIIDASKYGE